ncbi:MAG: PLD nuclease N-terminal domain-containing protein [Candidatus Omnitrophota bacterium]
MVMVGIPGLLGLLILVLDIIAIVSALQSSMDTGQKALWIVLILLLPVIGMVLYFLLGKKPNSLQE